MSQPAAELQNTSSPEYFENTFKVPRAEAEMYSAQARAADGARGGGITAQAPAAPVAPSATPPAPVGASPPPQGALSARAEYEQLLANRASGKINNGQWSAFGRAREAELANQIAEGRGHEPGHTAPAPAADPIEQHFAPPAAADDYVLPRPASGQMTEDEAASDRSFRTAVHAESLPRNVVESIASSVHTAVTSMAKETPQQMQARLTANQTRLTEMWVRSGEGSFEENMRLVDAELDRLCQNPALKPTIEAAARFFTPTDIDQILQLAKHRAARR